MTKQTSMDLLAAIEQLIRRQVLASEVAARDVLNLRQAAWYLSLEYNTLKQSYGERGLPFSKIGNQVYFLKRDLQEYMMSNRTSSGAEIDEAADRYVNRHRR